MEFSQNYMVIFTDVLVGENEVKRSGAFGYRLMGPIICHCAE